MNGSEQWIADRCIDSAAAAAADANADAATAAVTCTAGTAARVACLSGYCICLNKGSLTVSGNACSKACIQRSQTNST